METECPLKDPSSLVLDDASPEEKDRVWLEQVYQGDVVPQLTARAILLGGLLGMLMAVSNLYTALKLGWQFGVAITACVLSYVLSGALRSLSGGRITRMSILENNCMQSTASSAGYATGSTVGAALAALMLLEGGHRSWQTVAVFVFLTAALGVFVAIPFKRQLINTERLPFPSGMAAAETLRSLHSTGLIAIRKARVLVGALWFGGVLGLLRSGPSLSEQLAGSGRPCPWLAKLSSLIPIPEEIPLEGVANPVAPLRLTGLSLEPSAMLVGAGMIMGLRVSLSMLASAALLYYVLVPILLSYDAMHANQAGYVVSLVKNSRGAIHPIRWSLWAGTALMVSSCLASVALRWRVFARAFAWFRPSGPRAGDVLRSVEVPTSWFIAGLVPLTIGMVVLQSMAFGLSIPLGLMTVAASFVVALVSCRATGETDTTPTGAMGKLTQLLYAILPGAAGSASINLISAGTAAAVGASSADLLTDLKSGHLLGANSRKQFLAQLAGVLFGTLAVVPAWFLLVPTREALERFPVPAALMWKAMAEMLTKGIHALPETAVVAMAVGGFLGLVLPLMEEFFPRARPYLPSAMGLGLGLAAPLSNSLSFAIGGLLACAWRRLHAQGAERFLIPLASGLVAGESLLQAFVAMAGSLSGLFPR